MKTPRIVLGAAPVAALFVALAAQAQSFEPRRTLSPEGVEMLTGRTGPGRAEAAADDAAARPLPAKAAPASAAPAPPRAAADTKVSGVQQAMRDDERERILNLEILREASLLDDKRKALKAAGGAGEPDGPQRQQLVQDVQRHEENLRALSREITLLRKQRGSGHRAADTAPPLPVNWTR